MRCTIRIITLSSVDPRRNLVLEQTLLQRANEHDITVLIWQNSDAVIIGKGQNPWCEANLPYLQQQQIPLVRRHSGGGAVFTDHGNINFSLIMPQQHYHRHIATGMIRDFLTQWGINATINDRNDMVIRSANEDYKFSGSAYRATQGKYLHHGTLLIDSNLDRLRSALQPPAADIEAKGIASRRSHVINLASVSTSISVEQLLKALPLCFKDYFAPLGDVSLARADAGAIIADDHPLIIEQQQWAWVYGKTPRFIQRFTGQVKGHTYLAHIAVNQGRICSVQVTGNAHSCQLSEFFSHVLHGCRYQCAHVERQLSGCDQSNPSKGECFPPNERINLLANEVGKWLVAQIPA
ncbi:lipoate--protein ligase family protein [Carnimonas nigrificans]|uniref:lipoate--protein ligase family protein n=1 Tax=Carnimonas nigrificans TaxID=64323 RepID=UPI0004B410BF|nr:lipoate--protein ligase [Carnimonas nigrificans]